MARDTGQSDGKSKGGDAREEPPPSSGASDLKTSATKLAEETTLKSDLKKSKDDTAASSSAVPERREGAPATTSEDATAALQSDAKKSKGDVCKQPLPAYGLLSGTNPASSSVAPEREEGAPPATTSADGAEDDSRRVPFDGADDHGIAREDPPDYLEATAAGAGERRSSSDRNPDNAGGGGGGTVVSSAATTVPLSPRASAVTSAPLSPHNLPHASAAGLDSGLNPAPPPANGGHTRDLESGDGDVDDIDDVPTAVAVENNGARIAIASSVRVDRHAAAHRSVEPVELSPSTGGSEKAPAQHKNKRAWYVAGGILAIVATVIILLGATGNLISHSSSAASGAESSKSPEEETAGRINAGPICPLDSSCLGFYNCWYQASCSLTGLEGEEGAAIIRDFGRSISLARDGTRLCATSPPGASDDAPNGAMGMVSVYDVVRSGDRLFSGAPEPASMVLVRQPILGSEGGKIQAAILSEDGDTLAIDAYRHDESGGSRRRVTVYRLDGEEWEAMGSPLLDDFVENGAGQSQLALSEDGNTIIVGLPESGKVRAYKFAEGGEWTALSKDIEASDSASGFGSSVAMSADGSSVAVGARYNSDNGSDSGQVCVFRLTEQSIDWEPAGECVSGASVGDRFGTSLAMSADGRSFASAGSASAPARAFAYGASESSGGWSQVGDEIEGTGTFSTDGSLQVALSSSGKRIAVSEGGSGQMGQVTVYALMSGEWRQAGGSIASPGFVVSEEEEEEQGQPSISVALSSSGSAVAIGSASLASDPQGSVQLYEMPWTWVGSDHLGAAAGDDFGDTMNLAAQGTLLAVSSRRDGDAGERAGAVQVYSIDQEGFGLTQVGQKILGDMPGDQGKGTISRDGSTLVMAAQFNNGPNETIKKAGQLRVFELSAADDDNEDDAKAWAMLGDPLYGTIPKTNLGSDVDMTSDGSVIAASAPLAQKTGLVRVFARAANGNWAQLGSDIIGDNDTERFGWSVHLTDDLSLCVGSRWLTGTNGEQAGGIRTYHLKDGEWEQYGQLIEGLSAGNWFGLRTAISADGMTIVGGAVHNEEIGPDDGQVRAFAYDESANSWEQLGSAISSTGNGTTHGAVSLSQDGKRLSIGWPHVNEESGLVTVYDLVGNEWKPLGRAIEAREKGENFGWGISLSADGTLLAVGGNGRRAESKRQGVVRLFKLQPY